MSFLLKREEYWKLVIGKELKLLSQTLIESNVQEGVSGDNAKEGAMSGTTYATAINSNIAKWMECDFIALSTVIAFYLKDKPLQQIANCQTSEEVWDELNFIYALGDQNTKKFYRGSSSLLKQIRRMEWQNLFLNLGP